MSTCDSEITGSRGREAVFMAQPKEERLLLMACMVER